MLQTNNHTNVRTHVLADNTNYSNNAIGFIRVEHFTLCWKIAVYVNMHIHIDILFFLLQPSWALVILRKLSAG